MERINQNDVDCFLLQMERISAAPPQKEKLQEEWYRFSGFIMWIPEIFHLAEQKTVEEIFWSENLPDTLFLTEEKTAGITLQKMKDAVMRGEEAGAELIRNIRHLLEKLDDRTVCYGAGEEGSAVKAYWLEYKSFAADSRIYNVLFVFRTGKEWNMGTFFSLFEEYEQWKPTIWEMMRTIKEDFDERI